MATFATTTNPTPFGIFDTDTDFVSEADQMVTFVKRKLGDDILSVELTKKQIFANMEESALEYSSILNQYQAKSQLVNFLGFATGSMSGAEEKYVRDCLMIDDEKWLGRISRRFQKSHLKWGDAGGEDKGNASNEIPARIECWHLQAESR